MSQRQAQLELIQLRAKARVNAYAQQLEEMTDRVAQVGQHLMIEWRERPDQIEFDKALLGVSPTGKPLYVVIYDEHGNVRAASFITRTDRLTYATFLQHHREHCCDGWYMSSREYSPVVGKPILRMSHRLSRPDGSFAGVLSVGMTPDSLAAFEDDAAIGPHDFVTLRRVDGPVLSTKLAIGKAVQIFYKSHPSFDAPQGIRLDPGERFNDGRARWVAWRKHPTMPLVVLAAITEADAMARSEVTFIAHYGAAAAITIMLFLLCGGGVVATATLVARRQADDEVRQVYRTATDAANEGFYMLRPIKNDAGQLSDFLFEDVNICGGMLLGSHYTQLIKQRGSRVLIPLVFNDVLELVRKALTYQMADDERRVAAEARLPVKWLYRRAVQVGGGVALTLRDISETKAHEEELLQLAHRDVLTGLPNRLWLHRHLPTALRRADRAHKELALLFIDLDYFKSVNDLLGHEAGDELLTQVAAQLRMTLRASDHVARLGGDEFLVVIEEVDAADTIDRLAEKIISDLSAMLGSMEGPLNKVSASIGISLYPRDGEVPEELLKHADIAMYQSKTLGRSQYCWYAPAFSIELAERLSSEQSLRKALESDDLVMWYQPRFHARSGHLTGVEALVRWQRPGHGLILPGSFISLAESTGLIVQVGERVIGKVLAQMAEWQRAGLPPLHVAVNVSPVQLRRTDVAGYLRQQMQLHGIAAGQIDIEITESAMVEQSDVVQGQLDQLRALGVELVIDDFGAGYSSLSQLQRLDADVLKMDRGLVAGLGQGSGATSLCQGVVLMASALQLKVVAEGVETVEQLRILQSIGCDEVQGYLLSEPLTATELTSMLQRPHHSQISPLGFHCDALFERATT